MKDLLLLDLPCTLGAVAAPLSLADYLAERGAMVGILASRDTLTAKSKRLSGLRYRYATAFCSF